MSSGLSLEKVRPIIRAPDPRLFQVSREFDFATDKHVIEELLATFTCSAARGLAAVQIGHLVRAIVVDYNKLPWVIINPILTETSPLYGTAEESCLSYPWLNGVKITRPLYGKVVGQMEDGEWMESGYLDGWTFRTILHEIDHLNGITIDTIRRMKNGEAPPSQPHR